MTLLEILVIIISSLIVIGVIIGSIIRKKQGKTSCGCNCASCSKCSACKKYDQDKNK